MKRTYPQSIAQVMEQAFAEQGMSDTLYMYRAMQAWPAVVGPAINRLTVARRVADGVLYLRIPTAVVRQELSMQKSRLLQALNRAAGAEALHDIRFV